MIYYNQAKQTEQREHKNNPMRKKAEGKEMARTKCAYCGEIITGRHVIEGNAHFCNDNCADNDWSERGADVFAKSESGGIFTDYNDFMRDKGATIAEDWEPVQREF